MHHPALCRNHLQSLVILGPDDEFFLFQLSLKPADSEENRLAPSWYGVDDVLAVDLVLSSASAASRQNHPSLFAP
jgi:hypothetical protein